MDAHYRLGVPPRPLPPWSTVTDRAAIVAVYTSTATTTGRQAARAARALCAAGADGVEIVSEAGLDPAAARCSPAELVAAVAEEHLPVGLTVRSTVAAHLGVGAGAAWLRVLVGDLDPALAETLAQMGRPCIVAGLLQPTPPGGDHTLAARRAAAVTRTEVAAFDREQLLVELLAADLPSSPRPAPLEPAPAAPHDDTAEGAPVSLVVDLLAPGPAVDRDDEARRGALSADVTLAVRAGVRVLRTDDPPAVRRAAHVAHAIQQAR